MKEFVVLILSIIVLAHNSEPKGSSKNNDSDDTLLQEVAGWGPYFHEGIDPCLSNDTFLSYCVSCRCVGDKSADCDKGSSCFIPETPLPVITPCKLGTKFCIGPIQCVCHSTNSSLATCYGNNYETCVSQ